MWDKKISVIIPVYNEAGVIEHVVRDFYEKVISKIPQAQFIVAEDGSTDGTKEILDRLKKELPLALVSSEKRKGYISSLLQKIHDYDIVSGYKCPRRDRLHRIIISKGYNFIVWLLFGLHTKDIDSGFKLIKKKVIDDILKEPLCFDYCAMSEFILKAHLSGYRVTEVPVSHHPRQSGSTAIFTPGKLPGIMVGLVRKLLELKFKYPKKENK